MRQSTMVALLSISVVTLTACAEGRWVHATKSEVETQADCERCKAEVLASREHQKDTMAGGINLSGCMQSKGYRYTEDAPPVPSGVPTPR